MEVVYLDYWSSVGREAEVDVSQTEYRKREMDVCLCFYFKEGERGRAGRTFRKRTDIMTGRFQSK